jgi:hypothetical protein
MRGILCRSKLSENALAIPRMARCIVKLPRWLVNGLLIATTVVTLALTLWWWVAWPERTAREFACLIADGNFDGANGLLTNVQWVFLNSDEGKQESDRLRDVMLETTSPSGTGSLYGSDDAWQRAFRNEFATLPRTCREVLEGRSRFEVRIHLDQPVEWTVERGRITCNSSVTRNRNAFTGW